MPDIKRMMKESTDGGEHIRRMFAGSAGLQPCVIEPMEKPPLSKGFVITVSVIAFLAASAGFFALGNL